MNRCPITYKKCEGRYSTEGAALLGVKEVRDFPYTQSQQLELALECSDKLSIQGVQPKLSVCLEKGIFKVVQNKGSFILKLQHRSFPEIPQNEDLTMRLAKMAGIEVPLHGLIYGVDGSLVYFIQRFDREKKVRNLGTLTKGKRGLHKIASEDFGQLSGVSRGAKYDFSMEKMIPVLEQYCTFPQAEKKKLFRIILFSFLVGNEDLHVKNLSLIRHAELTELSPAYDLVNSTIVMKSKEELALPLRGKKSNLNRDDLVSYFGRERLGLPLIVVEEVLEEIKVQVPEWKQIVAISFLSTEAKKAYLHLLEQRFDRLYSIS